MTNSILYCAECWIYFFACLVSNEMMLYHYSPSRYTSNKVVLKKESALIRKYESECEQQWNKQRNIYGKW